MNITGPGHLAEANANLLYSQTFTLQAEMLPMEKELTIKGHMGGSAPNKQ